MDRYEALAESYLRELTAFRTVNPPGGEAPLAAHIAELLRAEGFSTALQEVSEGRANVLAWRGDAERRVIFTGHLDVVPPGGGWNDAFALKEENGRYYGRGTCDMKGGIAAMMAAAVQARNSTVLLVFVADEETDGLGTRRFVSEYPPRPGDLVVIGEPTELQLKIAHRGVIRFRVRILGRQCHSGTPRDGINAIEEAAKFVLAVRLLNDERQQERRGILPPPNVTVTMAAGGVKENVVPGECTLVLDCRTIPGDTTETLRRRLEEILHSLYDDSGTGFSLEPMLEVPPSETDPEGRVCRVVRRAYRAAFGEEPSVSDFGGCCDMAYLTRAGYRETLLCGPGSMKEAHQNPEFLEKTQLSRAVRLYGEILRAAEIE